MILISVIVPVYNTEKYLKRCLNSLVNQTLFGIEIIIVNDSSPDNSQKIIDEYVSNYPKQIRSFTKPNGGLSSARNFGVAKACGDYIAFVDSDDWVDLNLYQIMYSSAIKNNSDVVCCDFIEKYLGFETLRSVTPENNYGNRYIGNVIACNKIYKRQFWLENRFSFYLNIYHEDNELIPKVLSIANLVTYVGDNYYRYDKTNVGSITAGKMIHCKYLLPIIESLDLWRKERCINDIEFKGYIADLSYIYLMHVNNYEDARSFLHRYSEYFTISGLLNFRRKFTILLFKVNLKLFYKLHHFFIGRLR